MSVPESFRNRKIVMSKDPSTDGETFSVLTYNILAACHVPRWDYSYTKADPKTLELSYRHAILMKEVAYLDNDIVCLQEVGPTYWKESLQADMKKCGYTGIFVRRKEDNEFYDEGGATLWKESEFDLEDHKAFYLGDEALKEFNGMDITDDPNMKEKVKKRYTDRSDVLLITRLRQKASGNVIVVANIHITWGVEGLTDLRAIQCRCSKLILSRYVADLQCYCIFCGDFNSVPESLAYILAKGKKYDGDLRKSLIPAFDGQEFLPAFQKIIESFPSDDIPMKSIYQTCVGKEPSVTNFEDGLAFTLDYIFYGSKGSCEELTSLSVIDIPEPDTWTRTIPPDDHCPSDHLPVSAQFKLLCKES